MALTIHPISLKDANNYVELNHRHHHKTQGHKFSIACYDDDRLCGVAIVGRPLSRHLDDGKTLEILRCCTDGTHNACSILYGRAARIAKLMGYERIITYILESESGSSLLASGYTLTNAECGGGDWSCQSRLREIEQITLFGTIQKYPVCKKKRYERDLR